jgi:spoIIIJ-associated protein
MKETQEFSGKDVDAALEKACSQLAVSKKELKYKVISAGASGIFGIVGRKDAKIKVTLPETDTKDASNEEMEGIKSIVDEAFGEETRLEGDAVESIEPADSPDTEEIAAPGDNNHKWGPEDIDAPPRAEVPPPVDVSQEAIDLGKEALQKMADLITEDATIEAETNQDRLTLSIKGGNAGILIGRKGQTLDAMQFLTDKIINRKSEDRVRVKVDIEGYMETRKENLKHLAQKMADKAKKTGRPTTINQMSAQDRRIVHLALKDDNQVRTQSMGDGYYRRLVIFPKKKNSFRGKRRLKK